MEHSLESPPPRRGPSVDLDPTGVATGKSPDRQRRQFLNYSFYRLDPVFRALLPTSSERRQPRSSNWCGSGSLWTT